MKIGKQEHRSSSISTSNADTIVIRGKDLCGELIGHVGFTNYFWFLLTGDTPNAAQRRVLDATLVAIAEHGLVPSVQASRMTYAAAPEALQGAVAAGLLGCGSVILGAAESAGMLLSEVVTAGRESTLEAAATQAVSERRAQRKAIPGYGHPLHKGEDPRATRLFQVAAEAGLPDDHRRAAKQIEAVLPAVTGKNLVMNVSAGIPAVLLDAGFPVGALKGVPLLARTASLIANLLEEQSKPIGFVLSHAAAKAIDYDGPVPPGFVRGDT
ncbi:MAG: citryl-CoA lyase [Nevskiaceae bacterium]|jgi:citrate synthase|nr:citryl-CoA lyase [Nevskiaceae bacterium]